MKRLKRRYFKKQKELWAFWLKNLLKREIIPVVEKEPEKPSKFQWKAYWWSRGIQDEG